MFFWLRRSGVDEHLSGKYVTTLSGASMDEKTVQSSFVNFRMLAFFMGQNETAAKALKECISKWWSFCVMSSTGWLGRYGWSSHNIICFP